MSAKALTLVLVVAVIALPVPASQALNRNFSAPLQSPETAAPGVHELGTLLEDPFLIDRFSFEAPTSFLDVDPHVA